jgi:hypothetical protein
MMSEKQQLKSEEGASMKQSRFPWAIVLVLVIVIPYVILLLIGLLAPPFPNAGFGAVKGWLSAGLFSTGILSAGLFSIGVFSAGLFSIGIFSVGFFSVGIFSFGSFAIGVWVAGRFVLGRFRAPLKEKSSHQP